MRSGGSKAIPGLRATFPSNGADDVLRYYGTADSNYPK